MVAVASVPPKTLIEVLRSYLPSSLPLYRRLQFPHKELNHQILATTPLPKSQSSECFAAAYVERTRYPKTECWLYLSCERETDKETPDKKARCQSCTENCLSIIREIADIATPPEEDSSEIIEANAKFPTHSYDPNLVLIGSLHTLAAHILNDQGWLSSLHPGLQHPYLKYIFERESIAKSTTDELPTGLRWGKVREQDMELVQTRTWIPRLPSTLRLMPSIAIFPTAVDSQNEQDVAPIAWAFLNFDGAMSSLHVEDEYRGRGLAKMATAHLFREVLPQAFDVTIEPGGGYGQADVAPDNDASRGVMMSSGGKNPPGWAVYWVRVDLDKARRYSASN